MFMAVPAVVIVDVIVAVNSIYQKLLYTIKDSYLFFLILKSETKRQRIHSLCLVYNIISYLTMLSIVLYKYCRINVVNAVYLENA